MEQSRLMKRAVVFQNGMAVDGKVIGVAGSLESVLSDCSQKFQIKAKKLFTKTGGLIDDVNLIRDDDVLYVSDGKDFMNVQSCDQLSSEHRSPPRVCSPEHVTGQGQSDWLTLNIGGQLFTTTRSTLVTKDPESMLARMFVNDTDIRWSSTVDSSGAYLFDRSPKYFEPILNFLRHGQLILDKNVNPEGILEEAKFYGLTSLIEQLEDLVAENVPESDHSPITRREFILRLLSVPTSTELRCQGLNFTGANLSRLDLRCINFKYAILRHTNLSGANLSHCNFERADMCKAVLDGANLLGVKMLCVNLEAASLRGCNFEDPAGSRANMEGAQMKNVNLESSHMAGVNLRVATLKNANLQNCDLRAAVLAGADLENCDLSGCDLQEANLRGANLKGAAFELMLNPLHMAQAMVTEHLKDACIIDPVAKPGDLDIVIRMMSGVTRIRNHAIRDMRKISMAGPSSVTYECNPHPPVKVTMFNRDHLFFQQLFQHVHFISSYSSEGLSLMLILNVNALLSLRKLKRTHNILQ